MAKASECERYVNYLVLFSFCSQTGTHLFMQLGFPLPFAPPLQRLVMHHCVQSTADAAGVIPLDRPITIAIKDTRSISTSLCNDHTFDELALAQLSACLDVSPTKTMLCQLYDT